LVKRLKQLFLAREASGKVCEPNADGELKDRLVLKFARAVFEDVADVDGDYVFSDAIKKSIRHVVSCVLCVSIFSFKFSFRTLLEAVSFQGRCLRDEMFSRSFLCLCCSFFS
jgi:hypothetical protein